MPIFDTHAHYDDSRFDADRDALLSALPDAGVGLVLDPGCDIPSSQAAAALSERYSHVYAAAGIHPDECGSFHEGELDTLRKLLSRPKVVAVGEIGLDYYWEENPPRELQKTVFRKQLALAEELRLPVIIHDRDAHQDTYQVLERYRLPGVVHRFSGDLDGLRRVLDLGMYVSFGGDITHPQYRDMPLKAIEHTPLERILLETDAPYLAPANLPTKQIGMTSKQRYPFCHGGVLPWTAEFVAGVLNEGKGLDDRRWTTVDVLRQARENARACYRI